MTLRARPAIKLLPLRMRRQAGFTLVTAIFLITILFLLSAFMIGFRVYQDASTSLDTLGTRAFAAARSGVEWGAYQALRPGPCALGTTTTSLALAGTLSAYTATVAITGTSYNEAGTTITICSITATACNQPAAGSCPNASPGANYAERQITSTVGQP
jgi:MSHA biogenesis protein MshP